jgi:hypothetical protein
VCELERTTLFDFAPYLPYATQVLLYGEYIIWYDTLVVASRRSYGTIETCFVATDDSDAVIKLFHRHTGRMAFSGRLSMIEPRLGTKISGIYGSICVDSASDQILVLTSNHLCAWCFRTDDWIPIGP